MKNINDVMPKLPKNHFGAVLNYIPSRPEIKQLVKTFPFDSKWHTVISHEKTLCIDGKMIRQRSAKSYT